MCWAPRHVWPVEQLASREAVGERRRVGASKMKLVENFLPPSNSLLSTHSILTSDDSEDSSD